MNNYTFDNGRSKVDVPEEVQRSIIIDYFSRKYYSTVGILCFLLGTFFGLLIK